MNRSAVIVSADEKFVKALCPKLDKYNADICNIKEYKNSGDFNVLDLSEILQDIRHDNWNELKKYYVDTVYNFFKVLFPKIKLRKWSSVVVVISNNNNSIFETAMYLIKGMCKSFACEVAQYNTIVNCIECKNKDYRRLAELVSFFADERAYMTGQVITPDFNGIYQNSGELSESPVALITGSGQGIGLSMVQELKQRGYTTCLNDIKLTEKVKSAIAETGSYPAIGDISVKSTTNEFINQAAADCGHIDVFVANAAYMNMCSLEELKKDNFDRHLIVNIQGHLNCLSAVIPIMKKQHRGRIILFSSMFGTAGWKNAVAYAGTKAAMIGLGQYLSNELADYGISVSIISPGVIDTPQLKSDADDLGVSIEKVKEIYEKDIPLGRVGKPDDVAYLAGFLADGGADYLSGRILQTNGGEVRNTPEFI